MESERKGEKPDRHFVHCLICMKPQEMLATHLKRVCMKNNTPEEIHAELKKAKESQKRWSKGGRVWDYQDLGKIVKCEDSCRTLAHQLLSKGFLLKNYSAETPEVTKERDEEELGKREPADKHWEMFQLAKSGANTTYEKLTNGGEVVDRRKLTNFRHYCLGILMIEHHQSSRMVMDLLVEEWNNRIPVSDGVTLLHMPKSTSETHISITLTKEEELLMDCYFSKIRPMYLKASAEETDDMGKFFLGETGAPLKNALADLNRLCRQFKYTDTSSQMSKAGPSGKTVTSLQELSDPSHGCQQNQRPAKRPASMDWDDFLQEFPVTLHDNPPDEKKVLTAGFVDSRAYQDKWRRCQKMDRLKHLLSRTGRHKPTPAKVQQAIERERWNSNIPSISAVLEAWVSQVKSAIETDESIIKCVLEQKWKGIDFKDFGEPKGKGVIATMPFSKGAVVCDYHGKLISEAEGKRIMEQHTGGMGYLLFFKAKGNVPMCIDAQTFPCECHPQKDTFGRRINHSGKQSNIKPVRFC
ncbi:hypothetical protein AMEX_G27973 [Astyanax mexicanus]|uniref:SET domain-containing protein n=1 Tax=Astyanax mexicanus TaxID=7994 RepID=A0A8T2KJ74_ASTMX|nr:hypothetical protein AMEX_G27973 [Astyanax mexicanus]